MDKINLEQISKMTCTSKATVSRALNHCPGVDPCTRVRIQGAARAAGYRMPKKLPAQAGLILPTLPVYFWDEMRRGVESVFIENGQPCRTALYSSLYGTEELLSCIATVSADCPKILLIAAPTSERIQKRLAKMAEQMVVFLIGEFLDIKNTFYFGQNACQDGYALARAYFEKRNNRNKILLIETTENRVSTSRTEGFLCYMEEQGFEPVGRINVRKSGRAFAAQLARELASVSQDFNCVYGSDGILSDLCLAIQKLKRTDTVTCIGFEAVPQRYASLVSATVVQDVYAQGRAAASAAIEYLQKDVLPGTKMNYIASKIIF